MKKTITVICVIVGVVLITGIGLACHSKTTSAPAPDTPTDNPINPSSDTSAENTKNDEEIEMPDFDLQKEKEWISYYEDSQLGTTKYFDAAAGIIQKKYGVSGVISKFASQHFANYYLIAFQSNTPHQPELLDGDIPQDNAYLVDLSQKSIIPRENYQVILPLAKRVIEVAETKSGSTRDMLIHGLATVMSAMSFGNADCYDNPGDPLHPKATLESADNKYILKYYTRTGAQELPVFTLCTVTISETEILFESKSLD